MNPDPNQPLTLTLTLIHDSLIRTTTHVNRHFCFQKCVIIYFRWSAIDLHNPDNSQK